MRALGRFHQQLHGSPLWRRWQLLANRERLALVCLGIFLLGVLGYQLLWQPLQRELAAAQLAYEADRDTFFYMQQNAGLVNRSSDKLAATSVSAEQLQSVATRSAQQLGLSVERFDNDSNGGLLVTLDQAPFAALLQWIGKLEEQGVTLTEVVLSHAGDGKVDARVALKALS